MQKHIFIIKQIEISKDLINERSIQSYRIALLLLDNSIETLMYRFIKSELMSQYFPEKIKNMPYSFQDKAKMLIQENIIKSDIGDFITFSHSYRNEIYHRDNLRKETLEPLVLVLFDVTREIFSILHLSGFELNKDYEYDLKKYYKKYRLTYPKDINREIFSKVVNKITAEHSVSNQKLKELLINHLISRIDDLRSYVFTIREEHRELTHDWIKNNSSIKYVYNLNFESQSKIWLYETDKIKRTNQKLKSINLFMKVEKEIEKVEQEIFPAVIELDDYLDMMYTAWKEQNL